MVELLTPSRVAQWLSPPARWVTIRLRYLLGLPNKLATSDRRILEETIIPFLVSDFRVRKVLFVGCAIYTNHYDKLFGPNVEYHTIEIDPSQARYGGKFHVVDGFENASEHWEPGSFDAIVCNGVYGWGLNEREPVEKAFAGAFELLRDGGLFVLGWNTPRSASSGPVPLEQVRALDSFERYDSGPLGEWRYCCEGPQRHVFDFYSKPIRDDSRAHAPAS